MTGNLNLNEVKNLHKEILSLAAPSILANITVPLVGMADIAVAGHLGGGSGAAALIGGITIGTMLFDLLYWNFAFLRSGTGGLTAQAYGRLLAGSTATVMPGTDATVMPGTDRASSLRSILLRALRIAMLSGVALIALQWVVLWLAFLLVDCTPEVRELASEYFLCGLPAMGFAGVAAGTLIAQWCGFTYAAFAARHSMGQLVTQKPAFLGNQMTSGTASDTKSAIFGLPAAPAVDQVQQHSVDQVQAPSFFRMNRDLVLRSLGMIAVYIGFTVISAKFGDTMLAVSSILMKLLLVFSYFTDGFAYAGEALTGRFIGAGDNAGVHASVKGCFIWGWGLAGAFMLLYGLGGVPAFHLLTSDATVVDAGREFIPWLLLMPLIGVPAFIWDGVFTGATATSAMRDSTLLCAVGFFAVWFGGYYLTATPPAGPTAIHILMAAYFVHLAIRSIYLTIYWWRVKK